MKHGISLRHLKKTDMAAIAVCVALFAYLGYAATIGVGSVDETFYYTIAQRQLMGDRLLIDDWHVSQLSSVFQLFPYWLITTLVGSTEGIILNLRFLFLAVNLILYWFLYARLRKYGWIGLLSTALFSANVPMAIMTLNYYTMAIHGLTVVCVLLFTGKEKKNPPVYLLTGFVFACAVICQPFLAFVYFFWCLLVLTRETAKKKENRLLEPYAFFLNRRTWLWMTAGVVLAAVLFFAYLFSQSTLPELINTIPELFTDYEYGFGKSGIRLLDFGKIRECIRYFGYFSTPVLIALPVLCLILKKTGRLKPWRKYLFLLAVLCLAEAYASAAYYASRKGMRVYGPVDIYYFYFHGVPLLLFGLDCYLLCEKKDPRMFCFWMTGFLSSLMIDLASDLVMGVGIAVIFAPTLLFLTTLLSELRNEQVPVKQMTKKGLGAKAGSCLLKKAMPLCLCVILSWEAFGIYALGFFNVVEQMLDPSEETQPVSTAIEQGPLKGIHTTERVNKIYQDILSDLDVIKDRSNGPVYVSELLSYCYLYLDQPIGTYSTWYVEQDSEVRQTRYWKLHPEKRPDFIYVPIYDAFYYLPYEERPGNESWGEEKLAFLKTVCDCEITEGKAGFIVRINDWLI